MEKGKVYVVKYSSHIDVILFAGVKTVFNKDFIIGVDGDANILNISVDSLNSFQLYTYDFYKNDKEKLTNLYLELTLDNKTEVNKKVKI